MHYICSECGKPIGLIADKRGMPQRFTCPNTTFKARVQEPVRRDTPPLPKQYDPRELLKDTGVGG